VRELSSIVGNGQFRARVAARGGGQEDGERADDGIPVRMSVWNVGEKFTNGLTSALGYFLLR
jgi:hypothetical protein